MTAPADVVLTASKSEQHAERVYELGANAYVVKPDDYEVLSAMLEDLVAFWLRWNRGPRRS